MQPLMESWVPRHRVSVDEFHRMAEAGVLAPDARVELIEGEIIDMPPIGARHGAVVSLLGQLFSRAAGDAAIVRVQLPLRLSESSEPQPDLALVRPRSDFYSQRHPDAGEALLVVEVSQSSLRYDRRIKVPLYAHHGVAQLWLVDLEGGVVHFFEAPSGDSYSRQSSSRHPDVVNVASLPGIAIDLSRLLSL